MTTLVVMAKECIPGRVKTRLAARYGASGAAAIAAASLADTLRLGERVRATRRVLCIEGAAPTAATGYDVLPQAGDGLDERIAAAIDACAGPTAVIGMDTPQLRPAAFAAVFGAWDPLIDAWVGPATDGGFWLLALREPRGELVRGVPMSRDDTCRMLVDRLVAAGLHVGLLHEETDIDTPASLDAVAHDLPADGATARALAELEETAA